MDATQLPLILVTSIASALGIITMLVKSLIESRRQKNGNGPVSREELTAQLRLHREFVSERTADLKEEIGKVRMSLHDFRDKLGTLPMAVDLLIRRLERDDNRRRD